LDTHHKAIAILLQNNKEHDKYFHETSPLKAAIAVSAKTVTSRKRE